MRSDWFRVAFIVDRQLVIALLHEDQVDRRLPSGILTPLFLCLLVEQVEQVVEHLAKLEFIVEDDVVSFRATLRHLECEGQMLIGRLVVAVRVNDVLFDIERVINVSKDLAQLEGSRHLVTLVRDLPVLLRDEPRQAVAVRDEVAADALAVVDLGLLGHEHGAISRWQVVCKA